MKERERAHAAAQEYLQVLHDGRLHPGGLERRLHLVPRQRVRGDSGPVGLGQDDAFERDGRPGSLRLRRHDRRRHLHPPLQGSRLGHLPQQPHRVRVPKLQSHSAPDHPAERGAGADALGRGEGRAHAPRQGGPGIRGPDRALEQEAEPALGRPDAAGGYCPRAHQRPGDRAGRRAHRRPGFPYFRADHGPAHADRQGSPGHHGHPQPGAGGRVRHAHGEPRRRRHPLGYRSLLPHGRGDARLAQAHPQDLDELSHGARAVGEQPYDQEGPHHHDGLRRLHRHHRHRGHSGARQRRGQLHRAHRGGDAVGVPATDHVHGLRHDGAHGHGRRWEHGRRGRCDGRGHRRRPACGNGPSRWQERGRERPGRRRQRARDAHGHRHVREPGEQRPRLAQAVPRRERRRHQQLRELHRVLLQRGAPDLRRQHRERGAPDQSGHDVLRLRYGLRFVQRAHVVHVLHRCVQRDDGQHRHCGRAVRREGGPVAFRLQRVRRGADRERHGARSGELCPGAARSRGVGGHDRPVHERGGRGKPRRQPHVHLRRHHGRVTEDGARCRLLHLR